MKAFTILFLILMLFTVGCGPLVPILGQGETTPPPPFLSPPAADGGSGYPVITPVPTADPFGKPGSIIPDNIDLTLSPAQWLGGDSYLLSGPATVAVLAPGLVVTVEFYSQAGGAGAAPALEFVDVQGSDGWAWSWLAPAGGTQVWAEAVYIGETRVKSRVLQISAPAPPATPMPGAWLDYFNQDLGYYLEYPAGWLVDEYGLTQPNKEILINPPDAEPFIAYLSILLDGRTLDQVLQSYGEHFPDVPPLEVEYAGQRALEYWLSGNRLERFVPLPAGVFLFSTDRADHPDVQHMLASFRYTVPIGTVPPGAQRISFAPGATSAEVEGTLVGVSIATYVLGARAGQTMEIVVTSPNDNVLLTIAGEDGIPLVRSHVGHPTQWAGVLAATQDYFVTLSVEQPVGDREPYVMSVSITG